ncbi:TIGR02757 family protein [Seleniivibrio woodruffii]|uniref:TIGR02757 family protein n=1 Tax=Seleniivibrio woodruffii TaxID=1078050 RepID=UPI0026F1623B|nr:TIGR02757 family protein [Seleniivibrio woodruffii]
MRSEPIYKTFLEDIYRKYNSIEYLDTDPVFFPHAYEGNTEYVALTAAVFAYGNVKAIKGFIRSFLDYYGTDPLAAVKPSGGLYYRFQKKHDIEYYSELMRRLYGEYGSIENIFAKRDTLEEGILLFHDLIKNYAADADTGLHFLFPNPVTSGSKRLRMFLRWMIRKDNVDFGLWTKFSPAELMMIIDTHILRFAKNNGVITNDSATRSNLEKVSSFFRAMNPEDPAKYDFALTRLGIVSGCKYMSCIACSTCGHNDGCIFRN